MSTPNSWRPSTALLQTLAVIWVVFETFTQARRVRRLSDFALPGVTVTDPDTKLSSIVYRDRVRSNLRVSPIGDLFGRLNDVEDGQWRGFRGALPLMTPALIAFVVLSQLAHRFLGLRRRLDFYIIFGVVYIAVVHGSGCVFVYFFVLANYVLTRITPRAYLRPAAWCFNLFFLVLNDYTNGYSRYREMSGIDSWFPLPTMTPWHFHFNMAMLKLLSYDLEVAAATRSSGHADADGKNSAPSLVGVDDSQCTLRNYLAYVFYTPLYLAGPTMRFDMFVNGMKKAPGSHFSAGNRGALIKYVLRFLAILLGFELYNHYFYLGNLTLGISRGFVRFTDGWDAFSFTYYSLNFIWLKFVVMWRFFRMWALLDGVDAPENMLKCISNTLSVSNFWRKWHASFNEWLLRYMYIPLGGSRKGAARTALHAALCFCFVALWHDLNVKMLLWGLGFSLFMAPEIIATRFIAPRLEKGTGLTSFLVSLGSASNMAMLIATNLIGFSVGTAVAGIQWSRGHAIPRFLFWLFCASYVLYTTRDVVGPKDPATGKRAVVPGAYMSLQNKLRAFIFSVLLCCAHYSMSPCDSPGQDQRQCWEPVMYSGCAYNDKYHNFPTISALTQESLPRLVWGTSVAIYYLVLCVRRSYFSTRSWVYLIPEILSNLTIIVFPVASQPVIHYTGVVLSILFMNLEFYREGKVFWRWIGVAGVICGVSMTLHETMCFPGAIDSFALSEWFVFVSCCVLRSQPAPGSKGALERSKRLV